MNCQAGDLAIIVGALHEHAVYNGVIVEVLRRTDPWIEEVAGLPCWLVRSREALSCAEFSVAPGLVRERVVVVREFNIADHALLPIRPEPDAADVERPLELTA